MKATVAQSFAALAIFLINFNRTVFVNFLINLGRTSFQLDVISLLGAQSLLHLIGLVVGGIPAQFLGGRMLIGLDAIILATSWIVCQWLLSETSLLWTIRIAGFMMGMMQCTGYVYLAEIAQPKLRSTLMGLLNLTAVLGYLFYSYLEMTVSMEMFVRINLILLAVGFLMTVVLPESPHWLANKGRLHRVESSLAWFRGWTSPNSVKSESTAIINNAQINRSAFNLLCQNSFYLAFLIVSYLLAIKALNGIELLTYLNIPVTKVDPLQIFRVSYDLSYVVFFLTVGIIGQRFLILASLFSGGIILLTARIFGLLYEYKYLTADTYSWSLLICITLAIFTLNIGIGQIPFLLNGELFPSRLRYVGAGLGFLVFYMVRYGATLLYFDVYLTLDRLLLVLGLLNMVSFISLSWLFPNNGKKSIVEIEQSCNSIHDLRRKHRVINQASNC